MQHKELRAANEMAIQIVLLAVLNLLRPTKSCLCSWSPLLTITLPACLPARDTLCFTQKDTQPSQTCSGEHITPNPTQNRCGWCPFAYGEYKLD